LPEYADELSKYPPFINIRTLDLTCNLRQLPPLVAGGKGGERVRDV
jgi:hypothetical protein